LAFSPDGRTLVSAGNDVTLWDVQTREQHGEPLKGLSTVRYLAFSPDGRTLASASNDVILWDVQTREQRGEPLKGLSTVRYLAFSPDSRFLAAGGSGNAAATATKTSSYCGMCLPSDHSAGS
jgi:WD40 repeat protein